MVSVSEFLSAFYPDPDATICFRAFYDPDKTLNKGKNFTGRHGKLDNILRELHTLNEQRYGVYFVVNGGGHSDADIKHITAQFYECDTGTFEEQLEQLESFPLKPSVIVKTKKSLHVYFLMRDAAVEAFRTVQRQLVARFNGDPVCVNESRVMRIPGFYHNKSEPVMVELLEFHPELIYTQEELSSLLPEVQEEASRESSEAVSGNNRGLEIACTKCLFLQHCKENPKELSEHDWYAMITNLAAFKGGRDRVHEWSKPYPKYSARETDAKIEHFLKSDTAPIWCNTIAEKGWKCPRVGGQCGCNSPSGLAFQKLNTDELQAFMKTVEPADEGLRNYELAKAFIEDYFLNVSFDIAEVFICENAAQHFKLKQKDAKNLVRAFKQTVKQEKSETPAEMDFTLSLRAIISQTRARFNDADRRNQAVCRMAYDWLEHNGAVFYRYEDDSCAMQFGDRLYPIGNNVRFTSFLYDLGEVIATTNEGKALLQTIRDRAYKEAHFVKQAKWMTYDLRNDKLYINMSNDENQIVRITAGNLELLPNGINSDKIILSDTTTKIEPLTYKPNNMAAGLQLFKELVVDHLTCSNSNKLMLACVIVAMFLKDMCASKPILKFSGTTSTGKSTAAKLISTLVYGHDALQAPTTAALYSTAARDPLLVLDNLEADDMTKESKQFLLTNATGIAKRKRDNTSTGIIEEAVDALVIVTAIEPFDKSELINRTYDISFASKYKQPNFLEREAMRQIILHRDEMLSAIFDLIAYRVLPTLPQMRRDALSILEDNPHSKERTNDFLSIVMAILDKLLIECPSFRPDNPDRGLIVQGWLQYHNKMAEGTESDTDPLLFYMEMMLRELQDEGALEKSPYYQVAVVRSGQDVIGWECSSKELLSAFSVLSKHKGYKFEWKNARQLAARAANQKALLEINGWTVDRAGVSAGTQAFRYTKEV
jgi:hypothetical protein